MYIYYIRYEHYCAVLAQQNSVLELVIRARDTLHNLDKINVLVLFSYLQYFNIERRGGWGGLDEDVNGNEIR